MGKTDYKEFATLNRRSLTGWLGILGIALSGAFATAKGLLFIWPAVDNAAPSLLRVGRPEQFPEGTRFSMGADRVAIINVSGRYAAISTTCKHLGCVVNLSDNGFACPCHGSMYDEDGNVTGGPAPSALDWFELTVLPNGELQVNKNIQVPPKTFLDLGSSAKSKA